MGASAWARGGFTSPAAAPCALALLAGVGAVLLGSLTGTALPDLEVMVTTQSDQTDNAQVAVQVTVANTGDAPASNVSVSFAVDGDPTDPPLEFPAMGPGEATTISPTFALPCGNHNVSAWVDPSNVVAEGSETNNNGSGVAKVLPYANFSTALTGSLGNYALVANASLSRGCEPLSFSWQAAPGGNFTGEATNFSVPAGNVTLTLTATSQGDATLAASATRSVNVPNRAPDVGVVVASPSVPTGAPLDLTIWAMDVDGWVETYFADFGDGNSTTVLADMPGHRYAQSGTYTMTVRVVDNLGGYGEMSVTFTIVNRAPTALVEPPYWYGEAADEVVLNGSSSIDPERGALLFAWQFGDGQTSTGPYAVHTYAAPGVYEAVLTVTDDHGASNSTTVRVQVFGPGGGAGSGSLLTAVFLGFVAVVTVAYLVSLRRREVNPRSPSEPPERERPK